MTLLHQRSTYTILGTRASIKCRGGGAYDKMPTHSVSIVRPTTPPLSLVSPSGATFNTDPDYVWNSTLAPWGYQLRVTNVVTSAVVINKTVDNSYCSGGQCRYNHNVALASGQYKFEVAKRTSTGGVGTYSSPMYFGSNDSITSPTIMALNTTYTQNTAGATFDPSDPVNVCNTGDTNTVWYQYTAPSAGVYTLSAYGSSYEPNLTVVKKVSATSRTPVVCGETYPYDYEYSKLSFNAVAATTYLIGVSSTTSGTLSLALTKETCPVGYLCGVGVEGDGRVMHWPYARILNASNSRIGYGYGDFNGFIQAKLNAGYSAGTYRVVTMGDYSMVLNTSAVSPTSSYIYTPTAVGLPKANVQVKNTSGTQFETNTVAIVNANDRNLGYFFIGTPESGSQTYYLPAGTYSFFASSNEAGIEVYKPGYVLSSTHVTTPLIVMLDASQLAHDTYTFDLDGITESTVWIYSPDRYGHYMSVDGDRTIVFAAPAGTIIPSMHYQFYKDDGAGYTWYYDLNVMNSTRIEISGGADHAFQIGGELTVSPYVYDSPVRVDEGSAYIQPGVADTYGNTVYYIYYEWYETSGAAAGDNTSQADLLEKLTTFTTYDGTQYNQDIQNKEELNAQDWQYVEVYSTYKVTNPNLGVTTYTSPYQYLGNSVRIPLTSSTQTGVWSVSESVDLGPFGGLKTGSSSFEIYNVNTYSLLNDNFDAATLISGLTSTPYASGEVNAMGGTTETTDPMIPYYNSKGYASVWYKYLAEADGLLNVDTLDSDYDTVLTVWRGSKGALTNLAFGDDIYDDEFGWRRESQISLPVQNGMTYYIEVTQYVYGSNENLNILSLGINTANKPEIEDQRVGGYLHLQASLAACYPLTLTTSIGGIVKALPAPNCTIGTKKLYSDGTEITLTGTRSANYGFNNWTTGTTVVSEDNPYVFNITESTALKGNFVALAAPVVTALAANLLTNDNTPDFSWNSVAYGDTYEIQIDNASTFTLPLEQTQAGLGLTYTATALTDGLHYWRVRTVNHRGETGAWTAVRAFTVDTTPPAAPVLSAPADTAWVRGTPAFTWLVPATARAYIYEYADTADFGSPVYTSGELLTARIVPPTIALGTYYWHVKARDAAGNWSDFSPARSVNIIDPLPATPVLSLPATNSYTNNVTPNVVWNTAAYAVEYQVQVSKTSTFASLVYDQSGIVDTNTDVATSGDGTHYWRVRAINSSGETGSWSAVRTFILDTISPAIPGMLVPANNSVISTPLPILTAKSVTGARYYNFQVSDVNDFSSTRIDVSPTTPYYQVTRANILDFKVLYWRVRSIDVAGNQSDWSEGYSFTATIQKTPLSESFTTNTRPSFTWTAYPGATGHHLYVETDGSTPVWDVPLGSTVVSYTPTAVQALAVGRYRWFIEVSTNADLKVTPFLYFTVSTMPPAAPVLLTPAPGLLTNNNIPTFTWSAVTTASEYDVQISRVSSFATLVDGIISTTDTYYTPIDALAEGLFYWRVRSKNADGAPGAWSTARSFAIDTVAPNTPAVVSPLHASVVNTYLPKLTAGTVTGTKYYVFEVCNDSACSDVRFTRQVTVPYYTLVAAQSLGVGDFYWQVKAVDAANNSSDWSVATLFYVTNQKTPVHNTVIFTTTTTRPVFTWAALPGATGYKLSVYSDEGLATEVFQTATLTTTSYTPTLTEALGHGNYYWYVSIYTPDGSMGSTVYHLTVSPPKLAAPGLTSPATGLFTGNLDVDFSWSAVTGADHYELQVSKSSTFTNGSIFMMSTNNESHHFDEEGLFYWRVRSVNEFGVAGAWSIARNITVDLTPPAAPLLNLPANNSLVNTLTPTLSLRAVTGAARYLFQVDDSSSCDSPIVVGVTSSTSYVVPANQLGYGTYYWCATATDKAGNVSDWSITRSFVVTIQKIPTNGFYTTNARQPFTWAAVSGATGYEINVCSDALCTSMVRDYVRPVSVSYTPTVAEALTDGVYYWRIRANTAGGWGEWSPILKFTKIH